MGLRQERYKIKLKPRYFMLYELRICNIDAKQKISSIYEMIRDDMRRNSVKTDSFRPRKSSWNTVNFR